MSNITIDELHEAARLEFKWAKECGHVGGDFDEKSWRFRSRNLHFKYAPNSEISDSPLDYESMVLGKLFVVREMVRYSGYSAELIQGRLVAFRQLASVMDQHGWRWSTIRPAHLSRTIKEMQKFYSEASVYHRAGGLNAIVNFLNCLRSGRGGDERRFLNNYLVWAHGLTNPIRAMHDPTSEKRRESTENKYRDELAKAIGEARSRVVADPSLEPDPGYDRIRLEILAFILSMGLRIGEVLSLPVHALDEESIPGSAFIRVPVEKGGAANAMPVPSIWTDAVRGAYSYLLEICGEARAAARRIESDGFEFMDDALKEHRNKNPLSVNAQEQLFVSGLEPSDHFFLREISLVFDLSKKQFCAGGKYSESLVHVVKPMAARIVAWLDLRFALWDWDGYTRKKNRSNAFTFVINDLGEGLGVNPGNISKQKPFVEDLKLIFHEMSEAGCFNLEVVISEVGKSIWRDCWAEVRAKIVSSSGGAHGTMVCLSKLKSLLSSQYFGYLSRHYDEQVDFDGDSISTGDLKESISSLGKSAAIRAGVERKLGDHLLVVWDGQFAGERNKGVVPRPIFSSDIYNYIRANGQKNTIFQRLNIRLSDGEIASFSPHMIRHWVTTAMLRSGPNELAVDLWMNRTPSQGRHYDHRTATERAVKIRSMYLVDSPPDDYLGRKVSAWRSSAISEEEISRMISEKLRVLHFSPWGTCSRDLYSSPCNKGLMCIRGFGTNTECQSFQIDPEDSEARGRIEELLRKHEAMIRALEPVKNGIALDMLAEMNTSQPLDQHIIYILDVIRGCKNALRAYEGRSIDSGGGKA